MFNLTYQQAATAAAQIAKRQGFGVIIQRSFDGLCYVDDHPAGTELVRSTPVDASGAILTWDAAWKARRA